MSKAAGDAVPNCYFMTLLEIDRRRANKKCREASRFLVNSAKRDWATGPRSRQVIQYARVRERAVDRQPP
jgi:hypothetical protein